MSSQTPQTDLSIDRFRLDGMMLACALYGIYFLLTAQAWIALMQRPRDGEKIAEHRRALLFYVFITFALGSVKFGVDVKYTERILITFRDAPGDPLPRIKHYTNWRANVLALSAGHVQQWFMQALRLYRCFVIWNWSRWVMVPMITIYVAMIMLSIIVVFQSSTGTLFYNITVELAYLCIEVGLTLIYTILVTNRLFAMRERMRQIMVQYDSKTYNTIALAVIESAALYSVFAIIFIVAFAIHAHGVTILCFLSIGNIQGIAQLFIIIRVAQGRAVTREWSTRVTAIPSVITFTGIASDQTEGTHNERIARLEQDVVQLRSDSEKVVEVEVAVSIA
ncbi:hypothetical protein DEU56DRAFT_949454 [Suillus clintonianus]|uniref:uncharacterized protein n=1 Tax=Suillus clintonianus TaxID=1904413 RepID=UPI001B87CEE6|nr:uncharacterized protein DEU56DRAFT_949454 [Suillus clintonianus]KAG2135106.1 hypothetical protein DEU56DRAFT_949454 [Suillus clintonianus]